jgi:hypothetical protein
LDLRPKGIGGLRTTRPAIAKMGSPADLTNTGRRVSLFELVARHERGGHMSTFIHFGGAHLSSVSDSKLEHPICGAAIPRPDVSTDPLQDRAQFFRVLARGVV